MTYKQRTAVYAEYAHCVNRRVALHDVAHMGAKAFDAWCARMEVRPVYTDRYLTLYNRQAVERVRDARAASTMRAQPPEPPIGPQLAHCGAWQDVVQLPHRCTRCGMEFFRKE